MRRNDFIGGIVVCGLVVGMGPSRVLAVNTQAADPMRADNPGGNWLGQAETWLEQKMLDHLTFPLGTADWPEKYPLRLDV